MDSGILAYICHLPYVSSLCRNISMYLPIHLYNLVYPWLNCDFDLCEQCGSTGHYAPVISLANPHIYPLLYVVWIYMFIPSTSCLSQAVIIC